MLRITDEEVGLLLCRMLNSLFSQRENMSSLSVAKLTGLRGSHSHPEIGQSRACASLCGLERLCKSFLKEIASTQYKE